MKTATCGKCHEFVRGIDMHHCGTCNRCYLEHKLGQDDAPNYAAYTVYALFFAFLAQVGYLLVSANLSY